MSCITITPKIKELATKFPNEDNKSIANLIGLWQERNSLSSEEIPTEEQLTNFINEVRGSKTINYTPIGKPTQTYYIYKVADGNYKIINKEGKEVFKEDSKDRRRIFANLAVHEKRAVVVEHNNNKYVVNRRGDIISVATGDKMKWGEENSDRKAILSTAKEKFSRFNAQQPLSENKDQAPSKDSKLYRTSVSSYTGNITPDANTIFVFGSNPEGRHGAGAALVAREQFGAIYGQGEGLQGNAYALPTKDLRVKENNSLRSIPPEQIIESIKKLYETARQNPDKQFKVAYKNTDKVSLNGYTGLEMIDMFIKAGPIPSNIVFSKEWVDTGRFNLFSENKGQQEQEVAQSATPEEIVPITTPEDNTIPVVSTFDVLQKMTLLFDPQTRRDRESLIARLFSKEIDKLIAERIKNDPQSSVTRMDIIRELTPAEIFNRVADIFRLYINSTDEERIQAELSVINKRKDAAKYTDEQKLTAATKKANYKFKEFRKIVEDPEIFRALANESASLLAYTEGIKIDFDTRSIGKVDFSEEGSEGNNNREDSDWEQEENYKDGWMTAFRELSSHESLSQAVRKVIRTIPRLDYKGRLEKDDLGFVRYVDADFAHAVLIDNLKNMITADDMIPLLQETAKQHIWVNQIINTISKDDTLFSQFYQDFRKDFTSYWIQKSKEHYDGSISVETVDINSSEGTYYLLNSWRDNYESGTILDDDSIYDQTGRLIQANAIKGYKLVTDLTNRFNNLSEEEITQLLEDENIMKSIVKALNMVGINPNLSILKNALTNFIHIKGAVVLTTPVGQLLEALNVIFKGVKDGVTKSAVKEKFSVEEEEGEREKREDLINTFGSAYNSIATQLQEVTENAIESSVRENGKSYYSHTTPNYLGKLIKNLKNVMNDKERFDKFMQEEFKQYEWFYKGGKWLNKWLELLESSEELRKGLQHKVLLNFDKTEYADWDSLDYTRILLNEFWAEPLSTKTNIHYSWYHVPILSDSASAEFIRFRRYIDGDDGKTYKQSITEAFVDLIIQEYNRIMLVRERDAEFQKGNANISPIANYDIVRDKSTGEIKNIGGAEFKFLPALNKYKTKDGKSVIEKITELKNAKDNVVLPDGTTKPASQVLQDTLSEIIEDIMEDGFEETYDNWKRIGLLNELPNGKYMYLPFNTQGSQNTAAIKSLEKAKEILKERFTPEMQSLLNRLVANENIRDKEAKDIIDKITVALVNEVELGNISLKEANAVTQRLVLSNPAKEALRNYYWNSKLATSQIIELTTTDLAFYKDLEDFQKRFKEIHAPSLRLNTNAKFKGQNIGRKWEKTLYLKDSEIVSSVLEDIKEVIMSKHSKGDLSDYDAAYILSKYGYSNHTVTDSKGKKKEYVKIGNTLVETSKVNVADAQAYRSLSSYKAILGMSGQWTDDMETAFEHFKEGNWDMKDFNTVWQTKKPFVYTQINNSSGLEEHTGIKTPVQHKNSEFLLLAIYNGISNSLKNSPKMKALNQFMEDYQIDVIQFESAIKVGKQETINLEDVVTYKEVYERLEERTGLKTGNENPNVVHKISYEDYGIQTPTPEHGIDSFQLIGTQIRKLISADLSDKIKITIGNKTLSKKEWIDLYNKINTENILQSFLNVNKIFSDPKEVEKELQSVIKGNPRYGAEIAKACTLDENGNFNIPLFDPIQSNQIQTLLNSIIKNKITKQKIRGGAFIQVSGYGYTDDLHIVFEGEGENKRIKYIECYMPAYSESFFKLLMDPETGELDIDKKDENGKPIFPESMRRLIGYRVPTENKYSMAPLRIKGFLPRQNGTAIMLPAEITTMSGSDFDVDKMYVMLPDFKMIEYDYQRAKHDFKEENKFIEKLGDFFKDNSLIGELSETPVEFKEWFNEHKEDYRLDTPIIKYERYDYNKEPNEQSLAARNNAIIDLMYGVLTNAETASRVLKPGGFDSQKKTGRIIDILEASSKESLKSQLESLGINVGSAENATKILFGLDLETLNSLAKKVKIKLDPIAPDTQVTLHQRNMTGAKLIGIYANHNASHALMQQTELGIREEASFTLNGKSLKSLHDIKNESNEFITENVAGFLAASVDNAKDPILASLNQNTFTANPSMLLARLGYSPLEIGLLMKQPIILKITQTYFKESKSGKSINTIIEEVMESYRRAAAINDDLFYESYSNCKFSIEDLASYIMTAKYATTDRTATSDSDRLKFYRNQFNVGILFKTIMKASDALNNLTQATRSDTQNGAAGPTIADTELLIQKVEDLWNDMEDSHYPLEGAYIISNVPITAGYTDTDEMEKDVRKILLDSPLPFLQAFYSLGVRATSTLLGKYFPQYNSNFRKVVRDIRSLTKYDRLDSKTINSIYNDLFVYIMSNDKFFGTEVSQSESGETVTVHSAKDRRDYFINHFPEEFSKIVNSNEKIASLEFIKRLKIVKANKYNPVDVLVFKNVGTLSSTLKERYLHDWESLLYSEDREAQKLGFNLFRYNYFRNGFSFGPNTFIHLAPIIIRRLIPNYIENLNNIIESEDDYKDFVNQYVYNHTDNNKLVVNVKELTKEAYLDDNGNPVGEFSLIFNDSSERGFSEFIKKTYKDKNGTFYVLMDFIKIKHKDKFIYYRRTSNFEGLSNTKTSYTRFEPLGFRNSFLEYEYGKTADEIESVIDSNSASYDSHKTEGAAEFINDPEPDYDSQPDNYAPIDSAPIIDVAVREVYDAQFENNPPQEKNATSYTPNENWTDGNNEQSCK